MSEPSTGAGRADDAGSGAASAADAGAPRPTDTPDQDEILREWSGELLAELGLEGVEVDIDAILGLAGVAAHSVVRPAAPLTTFIAAYAAGLAVGRGQDEERPAMDSAIKAALRLAKARGAAGTEG